MPSPPDLPPGVRLARPDDIERIAEIHIASWSRAYRGLIPEEALDARTVAGRMSDWRSWLGDAALVDHRLYVIEDPSGVAGFSFAGPTDDDDLDPGTTVNVGALYLDPDRRGTGLGRVLLDHVLADFGSRGFRVATLYVLIGNQGARRFYARLGWIEEPAVVKECLGDGTEAPQVRYRKQIIPEMETAR
jgi:GNAT superfamily N-acetyltransferase